MAKIIKNFSTLRPPAMFFLIYALLVPFERLIAFGSFGTMTKYFGIMAAFVVAIDLIFRRKKMVIAKEKIFWIVFYLWATVAIIWSPDRYYSFGLYKMEIVFFIYYLIVSLYDFKSNEIKSVYNGIIFSGLILSLIIIYTSAIPIFTGQVNRMTELLGVAIDPNAIAGSLLLPTIFLSNRIFSKKLNYLELSTYLLLIVAILVTGSRGAILALLVILVMQFLFQKKKIKGLLILLSSVSVVYLIFEYIKGISDVFINRFINLDNLNDFSAFRLDTWGNGFSAWLVSPFVGNGYGSFIILANTDLFAHNIYLQILMELGIIGLLLFLLAVINQLKFKKHNYLGFGIFYGLLAVLIFSFTIGTLNSDFFWLAIIMAEIYRRVDFDQEDWLLKPYTF